jgi:hypothetical protein
MTQLEINIEAIGEMTRLIFTTHFSFGRMRGTPLLSAAAVARADCLCRLSPP